MVIASSKLYGLRNTKKKFERKIKIEIALILTPMETRDRGV